MGFFDPLRRAIGIPTDGDLQSARSERERMTKSEDPSDRFGAAFGDILQDLSAKEANIRSRAVQRSDTEWPSDPQLRWQAAAKIGRKYGQDLTNRRLAGVTDPGLAQAINARALAEAATAMSRSKYNADDQIALEDVLESRSRDITSSVHALISFGRAAELNARAQADALEHSPNKAVEDRLAHDVSEFMPGPERAERGQWLMEAFQTRMAMAQKGLLSPKATVDAAIDARTIANMKIGPIAMIKRRDAEQASPEERSAMVKAAKRETFIMTYRTSTAHADPSVKESVMLGTSTKEAAQRSRHAAIGKGTAVAIQAALAERRALSYS